MSLRLVPDLLGSLITHIFSLSLGPDSLRSRVLPGISTGPRTHGSCVGTVYPNVNFPFGDRESLGSSA